MAVPEHVLASAGQRFAGRFIDNLIFLAPLFAAVLAAIVLPHEGRLAGAIGGAIAGLAFYIGIQWYQLGQTGQTVGKRLVGTRVVDLDGEPVGSLRACFGRDLLIFFLNATRLLGLLNALFIFRSKRCGHDYAFGTVVVDAAVLDAYRLEGQGERLAEVFR